MVTAFEQFRRNVYYIFPQEKRGDIYFSQFRDGYSAAYKPSYPEGSRDDVIINEIYNSGAYLRGNYELIHFHGGKAHSHYSNAISELKEHVTQNTEMEERT